MRRYLIVANQTLAGEHLLAAVRELHEKGGTDFHVVVPATPPQDHAWTEGEARAAALHRLNEGLARLQGVGIQASGDVGDANPILAIEDALQEGVFDGIIISTLPPRLSKWLKLDLPHRAEAFGLPVIHVEGESEPAVRG
jgi:hypothetical protein